MYASSEKKKKIYNYKYIAIVSYCQCLDWAERYAETYINSTIELFVYAMNIQIIDIIHS